MKACSQVACLVLLLGILLAGCSGATPTPQLVATDLVPTAPPTSPPPTDTQPPPIVTEPPVEAPPTLPATVPPPTDTPLPTPVPATVVSSPIPTLAGFPQEGLWHGGGNNLLLDFYIDLSNDTALLSDVGILWEGRGECELNARYTVEVPVSEDGFTVNFYTDDISFVLSGTIFSPQVIEGLLNLKYKGCGDHKIPWRAVPKSGISVRP